MIRQPASYASAKQFEDEVDQELSDWKRNGCLIPFTGEPKVFLPLMTIKQAAKGKVRPVLDYRAVNGFVSSYTAGSLVCAEKLRKWRRMGKSVELIDLKRAYLQIKLDRSLWPYQVIQHAGQEWCLTQLGFGLNVAPKIMRCIMSHILNSDKRVAEATDSYYDDIIVDIGKVPAEPFVAVFNSFGLEIKLQGKINR